MWVAGWLSFSIYFAPRRHREPGGAPDSGQPEGEGLEAVVRQLRATQQQSRRGREPKTTAGTRPTGLKKKANLLQGRRSTQVVVSVWGRPQVCCCRMCHSASGSAKYTGFPFLIAPVAKKAKGRSTMIWAFLWCEVAGEAIHAGGPIATTRWLVCNQQGDGLLGRPSQLMYLGQPPSELNAEGQQSPLHFVQRFTTAFTVALTQHVWR